MKFILAVIASITILCFAAGIKTIKDHQDFDRAIEGMSRGVAKGMGITASATDEAVNSIVRATNIDIDDARAKTFAFVQTGNVTQNQLAKLGISTFGLAQQTGKSVTDTGKEVAAAHKYHH